MGRGVRISGSAGGLRCSTDVSMIEAPDFGDLHDPAHLRPLDRPPVWRVLLEREMGSGAVIVREVRGQNSAQMPLAEHDEMVEALAPHGADEPFREGILPGARGRRQDFTDPHAPHSLPERGPVDAVAVAEKIGRRRVVREGVHDLLGRPGRGGML